MPERFVEMTTLFERQGFLTIDRRCGVKEMRSLTATEGTILSAIGEGSRGR